jgi:Fe-S oxidoreductase
MQALKEVEKTDSVDTLVAICAICKSQFSKVLPKFDFDPYMIVSAHQLVSEAITLPIIDGKGLASVERRKAYSCHDRSPEGFSIPRTISSQPRML